MMKILKKSLPPMVFLNAEVNVTQLMIWRWIRRHVSVSFLVFFLVEALIFLIIPTLFQILIKEPTKRERSNLPPKPKQKSNVTNTCHDFESENKYNPENDEEVNIEAYFCFIFCFLSLALIFLLIPSIFQIPIKKSTKRRRSILLTKPKRKNNVSNTYHDSESESKYKPDDDRVNMEAYFCLIFCFLVSSTLIFLILLTFFQIPIQPIKRKRSILPSQPNRKSNVSYFYDRIGSLIITF